MYWRNINGKLIASVDDANMVFVGKAVYESTQVRSAQVPSGGKRYIWNFPNFGQNGTFSGGQNLSCSGTNIIPATGTFRTMVYGGPGECGNAGGCGIVNGTIRDEVALVRYYVYAPSEPLCFIHGTVSQNGNVASVNGSGVYDGQGWQKWWIQIICNFSTPSLRETLQVYCFTRMPNVTPSGYGIALYNASGQLNYWSNYKPLAVRSIMTVTAINFSTPGAEIFTTTTSPSVASVAKPSFASADWFRGTYRTLTNSILLTSGDYVLISAFQGACGVRAYYAYSVFEQTGVASGFYYRSSDDKVWSSISLPYVSNYYVTGSSNRPSTTISWQNIKHTPLPFTVPIINGADYD